MRKACIFVCSVPILMSVLSPAAAFADDAPKVPVDQLPKPVRETVDRESKGGHLDEVEKLSDDGHLFEAEIKKGATEEHVYIDSSGKVVGRRSEKE